MKNPRNTSFFLPCKLLILLIFLDMLVRSPVDVGHDAAGHQLVELGVGEGARAAHDFADLLGDLGLAGLVRQPVEFC